MRKEIILFFLIIIGATGCKVSLNQTENDSDKSTRTPIAVHTSVPKNLTLATYPEELVSARVEEYDTGWIAEVTAPNPLVIAKPAWLRFYIERGWQEDNVIQNPDKNAEWNMLTQNEEILFIHFEETYQIIDSEPTSNKEAEPIIKGETIITTYVKK